MVLASRLLSLPRPAKWMLAMITDALLCFVTVWASFYLRLGVLTLDPEPIRIATAVAIVLALPIFAIVGLYNVVLRFGMTNVSIRIVYGLFAFGAIYASIFGVMGVPGVPRTIGLIQPVLLLLAVSFTRSAISVGLRDQQRARRASDGASILIYGAGDAGQQLARAIETSRDLRAVGFVDDNPALHNRRLLNLPVYNPQRLAEIVDRLSVTEILLAMPSIEGQRRTEIIGVLQDLNVRVRTLPSLLDVAHGRVGLSDIKPLEIEDLLGRNAVSPDVGLLRRNITGRVVAVTGAGGSIGSELCRQIAHLGPSTLLLLENSEFALYAIHQELQIWAERSETPLDVVPLLASVRDDARIRTILSAWRPETIYHAAAYKHVPLVEHNPAEGISNNILGTLTVALAARDFGVANFVLISTDKAVRPTNIMGTTKRLAEMILQALSHRDGERAATCFSMVRFGNVLGSSGSVVPLFRRQIAAGGPITITDARITRYFMTIPEAAQLVIQAGAMASGGEVFVLDMGDPVRIVDLARNMVELSGLTVRDDDNPEGDIALEVVGLRPGEKLYEELLIGDNPQRTAHQKIMRANEAFMHWEPLSMALDEMTADLVAGHLPSVRAILERLVPEYGPTGPLVDLVTSKQDEKLRSEMPPIQAENAFAEFPSGPRAAE